MPELPEVEVTRRGLLPTLAGRLLTGVVVRDPRLRYPVPADLGARLAGQRLADIGRRGKYLLLRFETDTLIAHLGMSGSLRLAHGGEAADRHDHVDLRFGEVAARFHDPRRFGCLLWGGADPFGHPLIAGLGVEPLSDEFTADWLFQATRGRSTAIKPFLMDGRIVAGVGNIYAAESLFRAGIDPRTAAGRIGRVRCARLHDAVRATLEQAVAAGGSSVRDYVGGDGSPGYFQQQYFVYDREGRACRLCGAPISALRQAQRTSFFCPRCQR
jgi:formamidopyrimidine-DNA glycosylase